MTSTVNSTEAIYTDSYFVTTFMYESFKTNLTAEYYECPLRYLGFIGNSMAFKYQVGYSGLVSIALPEVQ